MFAPVILNADDGVGNRGGMYVGGSPSTIYPLTASGPLPITWSLVYGSLPPGMSLAPSGGTLNFSGTGTVAGSYDFGIRATNSFGHSRTFDAFISIGELDPFYGWGNIVDAQAFAIYGDTPGVTPVVIAVQMDADGFTMYAAGAWPTGLGISGTEILIEASLLPLGLTTVVVEFTNNIPPGPVVVHQATYRVTVIAGYPPSISGDPDDGTVGTPYTFEPVTTGGTEPYSFSITVGTPPPGTAINPDTGAIAGTPTLAGTFCFTIHVIDARGRTADLARCITIRDRKKSKNAFYSTPA